MENEKTKPVSIRVLVLTFNQEKYVEQALSSIKSQISPFPIRVTIHDDCSTDSTPSIIRRVMSDSPHEWELLTPSKNRFSDGVNFVYELLDHFDETFIARLDGDDYWLDPGKLDEQAHQLINSPNSNLSHHTFRVIKDQDIQYSWPPERFRSTQDGSALAEENFIGSSTVMFRRAALPTHIPKEFNDLAIGDYPLWSLISENSTISFIEKEMAAYRVHDSNSWIGSTSDKKSLEILQAKIFIASTVSRINQNRWRESSICDLVSLTSKDQTPKSEKLLKN